jgi:hypothetical protein
MSRVWAEKRHSPRFESRGSRPSSQDNSFTAALRFRTCSIATEDYWMYSSRHEARIETFGFNLKRRSIMSNGVHEEADRFANLFTYQISDEALEASAGSPLMSGSSNPGVNCTGGCKM